MRRDPRRTRGTLHATVASLILVAAGVGCERANRAGTSSEPTVVVAAREGKLGAVGIGSRVEEITSVFGRSLGGDGFMPVGEQFTGPQEIDAPAGAPQELRYRDYAFLLDEDGVFSFMTTAAGAETERGVGVGDSLDDVRDAYRGARCGRYDYGESGYSYSWCQAPAGENIVFFGDDPVRSITVTVREGIPR